MNSKSIYDRIEEVIYINLENATKRRERIEKLIKTFFPDKIMTRFNAIDRKMIHEPGNVEVWQGRIHPHYQGSDGSIDPPRAGVVGCYMSHFNVLKYIKEKYADTDKLCLVLEDDCVFNVFTTQLIKSEIFNSNVPDNWVAIRPNMRLFQENNRINKMFYESSKCTSNDWKYYYSAAFTIINPKNIYLMIDYTFTQPISDFDVITRHLPGVYFFHHNRSITADNYAGSERAFVKL